MVRRWVIATLCFTPVAGAAALACVGDATNSPPVDASVSDTSTSSDVTLDPTSEPASDGGSDGDAGPACNLSSKFGAPELLPGVVNSVGNNVWIWLQRDLLTAFITSSRPLDGGVTSYNVYSVSRLAQDASFGQLTSLASVNAAGTGFGPGSPVVTEDGLTIFFANGPTGGYDTWTATRAQPFNAFGAATLLPAPLNANGGGAGEDAVAWISPDGTTMYFMSNRAGSNNRDIWTSTRSGTGPWQAPTPLAAVNSAANEDSIALTRDELQAFLYRSKSIYYTSRANKQAGFSVPVAVTELNLGSDQLVTWVSEDGCTVYFSSAAAIGDASAGTYRLYRATRGK